MHPPELLPHQPPLKRYRIGEIMEHTGLSRQTIHNYTTMGLITEIQRTRGGHRLYDEAVFGQLHEIATLKQSKRLLEIRHLVRQRRRKR